MRRYDIEKEKTSKAEFDLMASITTHPSIVKTHEFLATQRWTYLVMEYFEGVEMQQYAFNTATD